MLSVVILSVAAPLNVNLSFIVSSLLYSKSTYYIKIYFWQFPSKEDKKGKGQCGHFVRSNVNAIKLFKKLIKLWVNILK